LKQVFSNEGRQTLNNLAKVASINLQTFAEPERGTLTVVESGRSIPFSIARIFYIYGLNNDCERGAHAHRESEQALVAISGSFLLSVTDARETKTYAMKEPNRAIYVPPMIWARLYNFSDDAVCLVLTSSLYDPADYIRDWDEFVLAAGKIAQ
jgi:oxalate decarboxylase/phosphoglucose isomerase-like protein (cupin superfamily)